MKKSINTFATIIAVIIYFGIVTPLCFGGMWLCGRGLVNVMTALCNTDSLSVGQSFAVLIILLPIVSLWFYMVARTYFKVITKINKPFITPNVKVFNNF